MAFSDQTVLIKKSDGSYERVSLAELKTRQKKNIAPPASATPIVPPTPPKPKAIMPDKKSEIPESRFDASLPLDEKPVLRQPSVAHSIVSANRLNEADQVMARLSYKIPADFEYRLRSVIQLRLKDIRSEESTRELALRSIKAGGLGLTESQADELLREIKKRAAGSKTATRLQWKGDEKMSLPISSGRLPEVFHEQPPAVATPFNSFKHPSISAAPKPIKDDIVDLIRAKTQPQKPVVHDIKTAPTTIGPVDEIRSFSLIDLRRLSSRPTEATARFKQKFVNLRDESVLLFLDALTAWRQSPLYQDYLRATQTALVKRQPLSAVLGERDKINLEEVKAIIAMEQELSL